MTDHLTSPIPEASPEQKPEHRLAVLMFTDLVNSSGLKVQFGDMAYATKIARPHNEMFRSLLGRVAGAREINYTGDGFLACFTNVADAVETALLFHHALATYAWEAVAVATRIGIHLGQAVILSDTVDTGLTIASHAADMCARLMSLGQGGQTLLTRHAFDDARQYVRAHPPLPQGQGAEIPTLAWAAHGPYLFKGKEEPLEVFEVGAVGLAPLVPPPDAEKAQRALRPGEEETLGWRPAQGVEIPGRPGWELREKLGVGGFGEVWLAEQTQLHEERVFKFCFDEQRLRSFKRELTFFRLIRDALGERADIARLYDLKLDEPPFFLESEFAREGNLLQWCERQGGILALPMERRLDIIASVAEAVAAAHSVGILHKDIKPQNVLMQSQKNGADRPQLTDFGIGALADASALAAHDITAVGFTVNTLLSPDGSSGLTRLYAPPEQFAGKPYTVQGDVYALGVMLYQIVVGDFSRALAAGWERDVADELLRADIAECVDGEALRRLAGPAILAERLRALEQRRREVAEAARLRVRRLRRRQLVKVGLVVGGLAMIMTVVLLLGFFRERALRQRASEAETLATNRLMQAERARDAAEKLVSETIFGMREKLTPIGKIGVLEDLAVAAENYYANLPPDLRSDTTRRHEVWLAINRAVIADAKADDAVTEASALKALSLARQLAAKAPDDESLREDQYFALMTLMMLHTGQGHVEAAVEFSQQMTALSDDWLRGNPKSSGGLRAKLAAISFPLITQRSSEKPAALLPMFLEAQKVADEIRATGGETLETRLVEACSFLAKANMLGKLGQHDLARKMIASAEASFDNLSALAKGHPLAVELMLLTRKYSVRQLTKLAEERKDEALAHEAYRQANALVRELTALTEFEPARLERWRSLAWAYHENAKAVRAIEGDAEWLARLEQGLVAADHTQGNLDRQSFRMVRLRLRLTVAEALAVVRPAGWQQRSLELLKEAGGLKMLDLHEEPTQDILNHGELLSRWYVALQEFGKLPGASVELLLQVRAFVDFTKQVVTVSSAGFLARRQGAEFANKSAEILRTAGLPAEETLALAQSWEKEIEDNFSEEPEYVRDRLGNLERHHWHVLEQLRKGPAEERPKRLTEMANVSQETLALISKHEAALPEFDVAHFRGATHAALGAALLEREQFAAAESALNLAVTHRSDAASKATDPNTATQRKWDATDSRGKLGLAIFKQGRTAEGVQIRRDVAETFTNIYKEFPSHARALHAGMAWRQLESLLSQTGQQQERLSAAQKALELMREGLSLSETTAGVSDHDKTWVQRELLWSGLDLGEALEANNQAQQAEEIARELVKIGMSHVEKLPSEKRAEHVWSLVCLRRFLTGLLLRQQRPAEGKEQLDRLTKEVASIEALPDPWQHLPSMRNWLVELQRDLAKATPPAAE